MSNRWDGIEEFIAVIDSGSFSSAANVLSVSKAHISQQVGRLEDRLGTRLLHRTTRKISLTESGEAYLALCRPLLEGLQNAENVVSGVQHNVRGRLRISSPHLLGEVILVPALAQFQASYPQLEIDIDLTSNRVNLIEDYYDIAIQLGARKDVNVVNKNLATTRFHVVASPTYIEKYGAPTSLNELKEHKCLLFSNRGHSKPWKFQTDQANSKGHATQTIEININSHWRSNSGHLLRMGAKQGIGIAYLPDYYLKDDLEKGELVSIMPQWQSIDRTVVAIYQHRSHVTQKIKLFIDFLVEYFSMNHDLFEPVDNKP